MTMQVIGTRQCLLGLCVGAFTLSMVFIYNIENPLMSDATPSTRSDATVETLERSFARLPPSFEAVWRHISTNASYPEYMRKPLDILEEHILTEVTGVTYHELLQAYIKGTPLPFPSRPPPAQVVIVTTWRSGSTFTEQLFDSHPSIMDAYEPLSHLDLRRARGSNAAEGLGIVKDLLQCRFTNVKYLKTVKKIPTMIDGDINKFCKGPPNLCLDPKFLSWACQLFPWTLIKTVRLPLALMEPLLESPVSSNLQIIYLVRDPRAVINSRRSTVKWCKPSHKDCYLPSVLCEDMDQDLQAFSKLKKLYPDHIHLMRYEDMMNDVMNQARALTERVGLNFTESMEKFVLTHSTKEVDKAWTTSRVSKERLLHWTTKLSVRDLDDVQNSCAQTMAKFGYKTVKNMKKLSLQDVLTDMAVKL